MTSAAPPSPGPPQQVVDDLVALSRTLGEPARQLAILAEGNTSVLLTDTDTDTADEADDAAEARMLVKASGSWLSRLTPADLVELRLGPVMALLDDPQAGDEEVARAFAAATVVRGEHGDRGDRVPPRPSVEAILHAVCLAATPARVVAHTHPVAVNGLLCSSAADLLGAGALFPDQIVVLGRHALVVPYIDPGLPLARHVRAMLRDFQAEHGTHPKAVYLRNHGMFALGASSAEALQITEMAVKVALVLQAAEACGGAVFLTDEQAIRIDSRPDEHHRRRILAARREEALG